VRFLALDYVGWLVLFGYVFLVVVFVLWVVGWRYFELNWFWWDFVG